MGKKRPADLTGTSKLAGPQRELQEMELSMGTMDCLGNKRALPRGESIKSHRETPLLWHQLQRWRTTGVVLLELASWSI